MTGGFAEGYIDRVGITGVVEGWARDPASTAPLGLELFLEGERVGATTAASFRGDLLVRGVGHGHFGFQCQIHPTRHRHGVLELRVSGSEQPLDQRSIGQGRLVARGPRSQKVESLLAHARRWTMEDLTQAIGALELEENLASMGSQRYIGSVYRFLLGRWPGDADYQHHLPPLQRGELNATDLFLIVFNSDERRRRDLAPAGPYDASFPFRRGLSGAAQGVRPQAGAEAPLPGVEDHLPAARLVSPEWDEPYPRVQYYEHERRLMCHPPSSGVTLAKIDLAAVAGGVTAMIRASVGHREAQPIEFALLLAPAVIVDAEVERRLSEDRSLDPPVGWSGWTAVVFGADQILEVRCNVGRGPAALYLATRMARGARDNSFGWASFSELLVMGAAPGAPADDRADQA